MLLTLISQATAIGLGLFAGCLTAVVFHFRGRVSGGVLPRQLPPDWAAASVAKLAAAERDDLARQGAARRLLQPEQDSEAHIRRPSSDGFSR